MYMDRTYVVQHDKLPTHELGLQLWKDGVVREPSIAARLTATLLGMVERERGGEAVDQGLIRAMTQMLSDLGGGVYADDFECAFLAASASFYAAEAQAQLAVCDCPEYLRRAEGRLAEEAERCQAYLDAASAPKVQAVVEEELLGRHVRSLLDMPASGLVPLLDHDAFDDLARMYALLRRPGVRDGLKALRDGMAAHLRERGRLLVMEPAPESAPLGGGQTNPSLEFVQRLLAEKEKYDALIARAFASDKQFQNAAAGAFEHFINLNVRSPEYISLYVDEFLRKGLKGASEEEAERLLDKVMMLFRFLQEKDVFEKYFKVHLSKRLLGGRTVSDDAERSFILKLKTECGYQFTSKIEGMFTDMRTSRDTMAAWRQETGEAASWPADSVPAEALSVQVLTTGSWPTSAGAHCNLPAELERCSEAFRAFYLGKHTGRRLIWQVNMGSADLSATFGTAKHELNVSTYQMVVLLLFNAADALSYVDIAAQTAIPAVELKRSLQASLMKAAWRCA
jgi:cullin 3